MLLLTANECLSTSGICESKFKNLDNKIDNNLQRADDKLKTIDDKINVLFKEKDSYKVMSDILIEVKLLVKQHSDWIEKKDIKDEQRDKNLSDIAETLKLLKNEQSQTKDQLHDLQNDFKCEQQDNTITITGIIKYGILAGVSTGIGVIFI